jgi:toxin FitB
MNLVDSSGWIEHFTEGSNAKRFAKVIDDVPSLVVPTICLAEVFRFILREDSEGNAVQAVAAMLQGRVIELDVSLSLLAAKLGLDHSLPLADSIIYATARSVGATVWTQDADFDGLPDVKFFAKP